MITSIICHREESTLRARDEKSLFSLQHNLRGVSWHYPVECKFYVRGSMYLGSLCRKVRVVLIEVN